MTFHDPDHSEEEERNLTFGLSLRKQKQTETGLAPGFLICPEVGRRDEVKQALSLFYDPLFRSTVSATSKICSQDDGLFFSR